MKMLTALNLTKGLKLNCKFLPKLSFCNAQTTFFFKNNTTDYIQVDKLTVVPLD